MNKLDPITIPLESINLIEASAGTGKSWTVTYLYLRLLLEKNLTVDQILVVTFTDAATKELRDDIRQRIVAALNAFIAAVENDAYNENDEYQALIENSSDHIESVRKLNRAKLSMDEAAVFTIHGFCQRSLSENAFEASLPFESELIADDSEIMQKLTDDFWRRYTKNAPNSLLFKLQQKSITPDSLLKDVKNAIGKPYLKICGPLTSDEKSGKWNDLEKSFNSIIEQWQSVGTEVSDILLKDKGLNRRNFGIPKVTEAIEEMGRLSSLYDVNADSIKLFEKFKQSYINDHIKAKFDAPKHPFFETWEMFSNLWEELNKSSDDFLNHTRIELIQYLQAELPKEKQRLGVLSFDDLLLQLQKALKSQPELANTLRNKYKVALIDEFQDTDPIQYDIFRSIYHESLNNKSLDNDSVDNESIDNNSVEKNNAVFFVGDPKQAIYSFRGGDIHTYLKAKADTQTQNTLDKNWRSHPKLINAFNQLYAISDNPFKDEDIGYVQVEAGDKTSDEIVTTQTRSALNFWQYDFVDEVDVEGKQQKPSVGKIRQEIANSIAGDIAQILNDGLQGKAKIGDKAISGGDIAILIRSHNQADTIKTALNARGIPSVQNSRDSIYETHEANELIYILKAILSPQKEDEIRRALVTEFMGYNSDDLLAFQADSKAWEDILMAMQNWHQQWKKQGFLPMMRSLMQTENTHQRLLAYADGERRISNVLQLSELIHQTARNQMLGMVETLRWMQKQQLNANSNETELRLESDEDLVKIVTIHKSKGLEYPIVYCPYIGMSGKANSDKVFIFNENQQACLEIGSAESEVHKELKKAEESAEDSRLLYVALTRAKYQCNLVCFTQAISGAPDRSALGWLLSNGLNIPSGSTVAAKEAKAQYFEAYQQNLQKLAASESSISLDTLPQYPENLIYQNTETHDNLVAREFKDTIKQQAQITSFSGLTAGAHDEAPDYDAIAELKSEQKSQLPSQTEDEFPRGATAGTALHEIFEHVDFVEPVSEQSELLNSIVDKYGFDKKHQQSATQLIQQTLDAKLVDVDQNIFSLKQLTKEQRLDEMEFYLPLERLHIENLQQILYQHLPNDSSQDSEHWQSIRDAVSGLYFEDVEGFLKGFIDLIFEHNGKYYLADYKSNTLNDYGQSSLFDAMAHSHYYLQYLFYSVALHRYLKQRIADYSWESHIGGAYYLFIRGMLPDSKTPQKWGGVFYDKPSLALIEALDNLFVNMKITS